MASLNKASIYALHYCAEDYSVSDYVANLTKSYTGTSDEHTVVATSVIMFVLSAIFFNLNLFSRVSDISAVLNPTVKLVLTTALSLFLPVMSYLFSEAKNCAILSAGDSERGRVPDLPVRARLILTWMLLVELLRKKVQGILVTAGVQGSLSSSITSQVTSVLWLGNLVFFNLKATGRRAMFGILWVLCAAKLVQRVVIEELGKRSMAYGKNTRLLCSYMPQMLLRAEEKKIDDGERAVGSARLEACKYAVMGEEKMVLEAGPHGYKLDLDKISKEDNGVVTVGKIWQQLANNNNNNVPDDDRRPDSRSNRARLKRLSLSFALFKLLRRRFEAVPAAPAARTTRQQETDDCRDLIFKGLCREEGVADPEVALFQVINDELNFVCEYYHSVLPVMFATPYFLVVNYFLVPALVLGICTMTVILCGNGNMSYSFRSIRKDNYALSFGIIKLTKCLWRNVISSPQAFFSIVDISISYLLFLAFLYEEVWEFIIVVLSNWFSMSLLCNYTAKPSWRQSPTIRGALRRISWVHQKLSDTSLIMCKQFSVLSFCWLSITLPAALPLPKQAKRSIMTRLMAYADDALASPLSNGSSAVLGHQFLSRFCESDSVAEVILTWHIATSLIDTKFPLRKQRGTSSGSGSGTGPPPHHDQRMVATILSNYCAYLLAFHPELLPDDQEGTKKMYEGMKKDLKKALGSWGYFLSSRHRRYTKLIQNNAGSSFEGKAADTTVVEKGVLLANELVQRVKGEQPIWELLDRFWVELVVYIGPSGSGEHEKAHQEALAQGAELVTLLWALTTQTGITRPPVDDSLAVTSAVQEEIHPSTSSV